MKLLGWLFAKVTYKCTVCEAVQTIPVRRLHVFERFYGLTEGQPVLIRCPQCLERVQCPSPYRSHTGHFIVVDPARPPKNAFLHEFY
jgi:uncharacterized protein YlaI